jgi:positive regulator of sigma E activity
MEETDRQPAQEDVGTVVQVRGKQVRVELTRGAGCKSCSMRGMCFGRNTPAVFDLETELELQEGDRVQLEIAPGTRILSSLLVFGMPMLFLFGGFLIASRWLGELPSIGIAFAATLLSFIIMKFIDRRLGNRIQVSIGRKV